jgi:hypothetical protein
MTAKIIDKTVTQTNLTAYKIAEVEYQADVYGERLPYRACVQLRFVSATPINSDIIALEKKLCELGVITDDQISKPQFYETVSVEEAIKMAQEMVEFVVTETDSYEKSARFANILNAVLPVTVNINNQLRNCEVNAYNLEPANPNAEKRERQLELVNRKIDPVKQKRIAFSYLLDNNFADVLAIIDPNAAFNLAKKVLKNNNVESIVTDDEIETIIKALRSGKEYKINVDFTGRVIDIHLREALITLLYEKYKDSYFVVEDCNGVGDLIDVRQVIDFYRVGDIVSLEECLSSKVSVDFGEGYEAEEARALICATAEGKLLRFGVPERVVEGIALHFDWLTPDQRKEENEALLAEAKKIVADKHNKA